MDNTKTTIGGNMQSKDRGGGRTRGNGDGSYRIRGKSVQFRWDGKTHSEPVDGRNDKALKERLRELTAKPDGYSLRETLATVGREWFNSLADEVARGRLEESTRAGYEYTLKIIESEFKKDIFSDATPKRIYDGINNVRKTVRRKDKESGEFIYTIEEYDIGTLRKMRTMMGQIYAYGVFTDRIAPSDDPMPYVPTIKNTKRKPQRKEAYEESEVVTLYNNLEETAIGYAARLCLARGYRGQEVVILKPEDIAEDGSTIQIQKALKRGEKGKYYVGKTKSASSDREDVIPAFARPWAIWLREHAKNGYILPNGSGNHITIEVWRKHYYEAVKKAGIEPLNPHRMRHTATTTMQVRAGISGKVVMAINGQSDERTMEGYNHVDRQAKEIAAEQLDRYMTPKLTRAK